MKKVTLLKNNRFKVFAFIDEIVDNLDGTTDLIASGNDWFAPVRYRVQTSRIVLVDEM